VLPKTHKKKEFFYGLMKEIVSKRVIFEQRVKKTDPKRKDERL